MIRPAFGETSTATYDVTYNPLRHRNRRLPFTVVTQRIRTTNQRRPRTYVTISKAVPQSGSPGTPQSASVSLTFDGRSRTGSLPTITTAFQSTFSVAAGYARFTPRGGAGDCQAINVNDPNDPFNGVDFGGLGPHPGGSTLSFCPTTFTEPGPGGGRLVVPTGPVTTCDSLSLPSRELGPISRAVPELKFCCAPGTATAGVTITAVEDATGKSLSYNQVSAKQCGPSPDRPAPACGAGYPISPNGEACLVESGTDWVHACTIYGLELLPQGTGTFLASELLTGPIHIKITGPRVADTTAVAEFTASLQSAPTPRPGVDEDGDGIPEAYDTCPRALEQLPVTCSGRRCLMARATLDSDNDCIGDACDCVTGSQGSDATCPPATACDQQTQGRCILPAPRIPTVTPDSRSSLGAGDPLSGSGLETDDAKGPSVAITPDQRLTVFGHSVENCFNGQQVLDGGATEGVWANCPFPHAVQWRTRESRLGPAWQSLALRDALSATVDGKFLDYWRLQPFVRSQCGDVDGTPFNSIACRDALETVTEWRATTNDMTAARLRSSGAITPRLPVATTTNGTSTALLVGLRDTVAHPPASAHPPEAPLHSLWYHGVSPMMGNLYIIIMTRDSVTGGLQYKTIHVQTGMAFADAVNSHGDAWVSTVGLAADAKSNTWWVTTACGGASVLCVYHLTADGLPISQQRIPAGGGGWFDTYPTPRDAGGIYVAGMRVSTCQLNCPEFPGNAETVGWLVDDESATEILAPSSIPFTVAPAILDDGNRVVVVDTQLIDIDPQGGNSQRTADARVSDQMQTNVRVSHVANGSRTATTTWPGLSPVMALRAGTQPEPTCTLAHCPIASLRPAHFSDASHLSGAFPVGNLVAGELGQQPAQVLLSNLTVGGFPASVAVPSQVPGSRIFVAKDNANREYRLTVAAAASPTVAGTFSASTDKMMTLQQALSEIPPSLVECASTGVAAPLAGGLVPTFLHSLPHFPASTAFIPPSTDLGFLLGQYWTTRVRVTPGETRVQFTPNPLPVPFPATTSTLVTDFTVRLISTDSPLPAGFIDCATTGNQVGCLPAPDPIDLLSGVFPETQARQRANAIHACEKRGDGKVVCLEVGFFRNQEAISNCDTWSDSSIMLFQALAACRDAYDSSCTTDACRDATRACHDFSLFSLVPGDLANLQMTTNGPDQTTTLRSVEFNLEPLSAPGLMESSARRSSIVSLERSLHGQLTAAVDLNCFDSPGFSFPIPYLTSSNPGHVCFSDRGRAFTLSFDVNLEFSVFNTTVLGMSTAYRADMRGDGFTAHPLANDTLALATPRIRNLRTNLNGPENALVVSVVGEPVFAQISSRAPGLIRQHFGGVFGRVATAVGDRLSARLLRATNAFEADYETAPLSGPGFGLHFSLRQRLTVHDDALVDNPAAPSGKEWEESNVGAFLMGTSQLNSGTLLFRELDMPWF